MLVEAFLPISALALFSRRFPSGALDLESLQDCMHLDLHSDCNDFVGIFLFDYVAKPIKIDSVKDKSTLFPIEIGDLPTILMMTVALKLTQNTV